MASVNFLKITRQTAGALRVHLDDYQRRTHTHSNRHIDVKQSYKNFFLGESNYDECLARLDERVRQVDKEHPPKRRVKDRKVACLLEATCPQSVASRGRADEFFHAFYNLLKSFFGERDVIGAVVHKDEVHEYIDKDGTRRQSLEHIHAIVTCYAEWTDAKGIERKGINGKHFETKEMLTRFNEAVDEMCVKTFGVEYNSHGLVEGMSVEELKRRSSAKEELAKHAELVEEHNTLIDTIEELRQGAVELAYEVIDDYERDKESGKERW